MNAPTTRGQAIRAKCKDCIYDPEAGGTWTEQVACCTSLDCPLWRFRPLSRNAPEWLRSRDPADLPKGWTGLAHDEALKVLRAGTGDNANGSPVQAIRGARAPSAMQHQGGTR